MRTTDKTACKSCHLNDWYIFVIGSIVQSQNWFKVQTKTHSNTNNLILHSNCIQFYLFKDLLDPSDQNCVLTIRSVELWPKNLLETGRWLSTRKIWFENILRWFDVGTLPHCGHTATLWGAAHLWQSLQVLPEVVQQDASCKKMHLVKIKIHLVGRFLECGSIKVFRNVI